MAATAALINLARIDVGSINYLFPSEQLHNLPTWRFVFHFPGSSDCGNLAAASTALKQAEFSIVQFPAGLDLRFDEETQSVDVYVEVNAADRRRRGALAAYESDVWKILGNMAGCGYEDVYYEAVGWSDELALSGPKKWWQFWK